MTTGRWHHAIVALFVCFATVVFAQQQETGRIEGVLSREGEGIGTVVVLINELMLTEVTDPEGKFAFENVPPGTYTLVFTSGDRTEVRPNVIVTAGRTHSMTMEVEWDVVTETVRVTAAAAAAKIVDAPSAVTVIPEAQIQKQASHGQAPKLLEFTPGAEVTQSGLYDFNFNTRGFNSSLNRRVSTYIDGRDVGVVLLGAQEWAAISGGLGDIQTLEFIRGPSAALYGANASSGVVNITTKAPRDNLGTVVRVSGGDLDSNSMDFMRSAKVPGGWYSKVTAGFKNSGDFSVSRNPDGPDGIPDTADDLEFPEYQEVERPGQETEWCNLIGETDCLPKEKSLFREQDNDIRYGSVRFDKYLDGDQLLTLEAGVSVIKGPLFQTGIGRVQNLSSTRPFYRVAWSNPHWNVLAHHSRREGNQVNLTADLVDVLDDLITDSQRTGIEGQGHWSFKGGRGRFVIGAAHTEEKVDTTNPLTGGQTVLYEPIRSDRQAVFSQVDWKVNDKFKLVFAGRVDKSTLHETQFSPKAAAVYSFDRNNSIRVTFNEAFQVANYSEFFLHAQISSFPIGGFIRTFCQGPLGQIYGGPDGIDCGIDGDFIPILAVGNDDLELEQTSAWEIGYSGLLWNRVFVTLDYYNSRNENFITDLIPQVGTFPGNLDGCVDINLMPVTDPARANECPINNDYLPWIGTDEAENTFITLPNRPPLSFAQGIRNFVDATVGGQLLGFRLAQDLDGSTVVVGRTYANVGEVTTQGVDFGVQYFVNENWNLQASYSWFDFDIVGTDQLSSTECVVTASGAVPSNTAGCILLPNSPEHKGSLSAIFSKNRWSAGIAGRWVEGFRWAAGVFQGNVPEPLTRGPAEDFSYHTVDVNASVNLNEVMSLGLNVANATDNVHRQTFGGDLLRRRAILSLTFGW
jgi:iron complex outermembrane receptor protein